MKTYSIPETDLKPTRIAYGCMKLGGSWDDQPISDSTRKAALASLHAALEGGINFFDHADIYARGKSEEVFAALLKESPALRGKIYIQTKCGIRFAGDPQPASPHRFDFSYEHILRSVEGSLRRLNTDYLDVLLLHRPDPLVEPEEVARAFDELHAAGKVRYFGVSNHNAAQLALLQAVVRQPLVFNQMEINPINNHLFNEGVITNQTMPPQVVRGDGTLEYCRLHHITLQAWAPLVNGRLSGGARSPLSPAEASAAAVVEEIASERHTSREAVLIAWLLRHPARIQPIIGTTDPKRILACCAGDQLDLSREEWYRLFTAGRGEPLP